MKKYGLQLRVPPSQQKKQPTRPPLSNPLGFGEEDDDDTVERDILRQASKNQSLKDIEQQHKKAMEEDPSVFDYDGVYDKMKETQVRPVAQDRQDRKPRYIQKIIEKAKQREREQEVIYERKLAKERSKDEHLYADKDKYVSSAYKKKLAEQAKWLEEERLRELREAKDDVTNKTDISDFYFNLAKNVAYGGAEANRHKAGKPQEKAVVSSPEEPPQASDSSSEPSTSRKRLRDETLENPDTKEKSEQGNEKPISDAPVQDKVPAETEASEKPRPDHHKRNEDTLAAARERFLARKRANQQ